MNWHDRYLLQAGWTHELRTYLFGKAGLSSARRVLEVGCGTGAILSEISLSGSDINAGTVMYGVDRSAAVLTECRNHAPAALLTRADALALPFPDKIFDITYCHFLLLWVHDPLLALHEMMRVIRPRGHILVLAEPDYTARVDQPREIEWLGKLQTESLERQGADVTIGSRLADLFYQSGISILETGTIQNRVNKMLSREEWENEWSVLQADLAETVTGEKLQEMKRMDEQAWRRGEHEMNVPTYFAWGQV